MVRVLSRPRDATLPAAVCPAVICVVGVVELAALRTHGWGYGAAVEVAACTLLVWRRRNPLVFATLATVVQMVMPWVGPQLHEASTPILIGAVSAFSLARWVHDLRGLVGLGVMASAILAAYVFVDARSHNWSDVVFVSALLVPPYVFGRITRRLADQKALLEQQQELVKREAARDERDRIARELHDVIAHSVSAMVVQTAAAQDLVRSDPEKAEEVLAAVAATGRRALSETGRLLHLIRDDADELGLQPAPGLSDLPSLVERFRAHGLQVAMEVDEPLPPLPAGVDVSAYRIVQEALTNALRYGADRNAALRLTSTPTTLSICASNSSSGLTGVGSGLGLLGLAERVKLMGGELSHGVTGDGQFRLDVTLPLAAR